MEKTRLFSLIIFLSFFIGLLTFSSVKDSNIDGFKSFKIFENQKTHKHALFYLIYNGSARKFDSKAFQLNSRKVHLENNKSHIVHAHKKGVTWNKFLKTIHINKNSTSRDLCIETIRFQSCNVTISLNGETISDLNVEINQGDNLVIVINSENKKQIKERYSDYLLPNPYIPTKNSGKSI
ncbi:MAG: hypothetical protein ABEI78_01580 [Candidatus Nanohaloarchaea archaeon]